MRLALVIALMVPTSCIASLPPPQTRIAVMAHDAEALRTWVVVRKANGAEDLYYCTAGAKPEVTTGVECMRAYPDRVITPKDSE